MNFLQLCQEAVNDLGVNGLTGPPSVIGQTSELKNIVRWTRDADTSICLLWQDWKFLWRRAQLTLQLDALVPAIPGAVKVSKWRHKLRDGGSAFYLNRDQADWTRLVYVPWDEFHGALDVGAIATRRPSMITERPDRRLQFETIPDQTYTLDAEYWTQPVPMSVNTSLPNVPEDFYRIIIARVKIAYGAHEDAPELLTDGEAEYADLLEKLESRELEGFEAHRSATEDRPMMVEII